MDFGQRDDFRYHYEPLKQATDETRKQFNTLFGLGKFYKKDFLLSGKQWRRMLNWWPKNRRRLLMGHSEDKLLPWVRVVFQDSNHYSHSSSTTPPPLYVRTTICWNPSKPCRYFKLVIETSHRQIPAWICCFAAAEMRLLPKLHNPNHTPNKSSLRKYRGWGPRLIWMSRHNCLLDSITIYIQQLHQRSSDYCSRFEACELNSLLILTQA